MQRHRPVADDAYFVPFARSRDAHLARPEHGRLPRNRELRLAVHHQEHLVTDVVSVTVADLARLEAHDARSDLGCYEEIPDVRPSVKNFERHASPPAARSSNEALLTCRPAADFRTIVSQP